MKHLLLILSLAATTSLIAQAPTDTLDQELTAKVIRLLEVSGGEAQFIGVIDNMIDMQMQSPAYAEVPDEYWEEFRDEVHATGFRDIAERLAPVYLEYYSEEEIDHQLAYYDDPMTREIVAKQPQVLQQSMTIGQEWGMALAQRIMQQLQEDFEDDGQ